MADAGVLQREPVQRLRTNLWLAYSALLIPLSQLTAQAGGLHPNPRYLDAPVPPAFTIALAARQLASLFHLAETARAAFGGEADSDAGLIGHVKGIELLSSGDVVVLDDKLSQLRLFRATGAAKQRLGRPGRGPGEFSNPVSLTVDADGRIYVGDLSRAVQVFSPGPAGYRYERTLRLDIAPQAMCFLEGQLVVQGMLAQDASVLHLYDPSGRRLRSFGALYRSPNPLLNRQLGVGQVVCDPLRKLVFYSPRSAIGEVRAYRLDGSLVWRTAITGYRVNRIEDYRGGYRVTATPDGVNSLHQLTLLPGRGLLVQVAFRTRAALREAAAFTTLSSFLLDPATGRPLPLGTALPPILAASPREVALAFDDPVPRFEVRALRAPEVPGKGQNR